MASATVHDIQSPASPIPSLVADDENPREDGAVWKPGEENHENLSRSGENGVHAKDSVNSPVAQNQFSSTGILNGDHEAGHPKIGLGSIITKADEVSSVKPVVAGPDNPSHTSPKRSDGILVTPKSPKPILSTFCPMQNYPYNRIQSTCSSLGRYLARRLVQIGASDVFSVPGDFNLVLLDHLLSEPNLKLIGCCNELNAGYAADGYARANGVGACVVTFTVGGLSILNAIAGAYSENLPVICIVGGPNSNDYGTNRILHHTIGLPDFSQELRCFQQVTCCQVRLMER